MIKVVVSIVAAFATASLLALPDVAWARGGGHHGGGHHGGARSGLSHHHVHGTVFVGGALFYPGPYSYYFYPVLAGVQEQVPILYVEQFSGTPTPDTKNWIYCPNLAASYPDVTDCPGGWQRVIPQEQATHQAPAR